MTPLQAFLIDILIISVLMVIEAFCYNKRLVRWLGGVALIAAVVIIVWAAFYYINI